MRSLTHSDTWLLFYSQDLIFLLPFPHVFQRGPRDKRGMDMIKTTKFQVYINKIGDKQACHSSIQKAPFQVKSRVSVYTLLSISRIHQTTTTTLWLVLSHFFSLSIPAWFSQNCFLVATSLSISEKTQYFHGISRDLPFHTQLRLPSNSPWENSHVFHLVKAVV